MDALACLLMDTAKKVRGRLTKSLKKYNITCRQAIVLRSLEKEKLSAKKIGDMCSIDKATLSNILVKLIGHGFVSCSVNSNDRRGNIYAITQNGIDMLPNVSSIEDEYKNELQKSLSLKDYDELMRLLGKLNE